MKRHTQFMDIFCVDGLALSSKHKLSKSIYDVLGKNPFPEAFKKLHVEKAKLFDKKQSYNLALKILSRSKQGSDFAFICGKSLGALKAVEAINYLPEPTSYLKVILLTVDPDWPKWLYHSRNEQYPRRLVLKKQHVDIAYNIISGQNDERGRKVWVQYEPKNCSVRVLNIVLPESTHRKIASTHYVRQTIRELMGRLING